MAELLRNCRLFRRDGTEVPSAALDGKLTGLYFSAVWCPSCREFTPILARFYQALRRDGAPFEVVYVSRDRSYEAQREHMDEAHGDWLHLRQGERAVPLLMELYRVKTIPSLVVVDAKGGVVSRGGRDDVYAGLIAFDKWRAAIPHATAPPTLPAQLR